MESSSRHRDIFLVLFQITYIISSLLGLAPYSIEIFPQCTLKNTLICSFSYSRLKCGYNIFLIVALIGVITVGTPLLDNQRFPNDSPIVRLITLTLATMGNIVAIVIIVITLVIQRDVVRIGNQLGEFDANYGDELGEDDERILRGIRPFITAVLMILIWIAVVMTLITEQVNGVYLITSGFSEAFASWLLLQYSLIVNVLKVRLEGINNLLVMTKNPVDVVEVSFNRRCKFNDLFIVQKLIMIKRGRNRIYKISCDVARLHSFPVLLVIFYCCCCSVNTIYIYIMFLIYPMENNGGYTSLILWCAVTLYPIVVMSISVNRFQAEEARTAEIIYDIMGYYSSNKDVEIELNNFAIELLHKNVSFDACGLFSLDCTLLHSIFGMIVTYLVILVQFNTPDYRTNN